jgi:hypothetical protein
MRQPDYLIADEPHPGRFEAWVVQPFIPLLATMLVGSLVGLPWLVFNGWAMGSVTRRRDTVIAAVTWFVQVVLLLSGILLATFRLMPEGRLGYVRIFASVVVLLGAYAIQLSQEASFELHQYFGGRVWPRGWQLLGVLFLLRMLLLGGLVSA